MMGNIRRSLGALVLVLIMLAAGSAGALSGWTSLGGQDTLFQKGNYGTEGTPSADVNPGVRDGALRWTATDGTLWMFGGYGYDVNGDLGFLSDVWNYNPSTGMWTRHSGSIFCNTPGVYRDPQDSQGNPIPVAHYPGGRSNAVTWIGPDGLVWVFGGMGCDEDGLIGEMNDLWAFNPSTGVWTWVDGYSLFGVYGSYGTKGTADVNNWPGGRSAAAAYYQTGTGKLWVFGGEGYASTGFADYLNDLWMFDTASMKWTWMGGSSTAGMPGNIGAPMAYNAASAPGARAASAAWMNADGTLWIFGGIGLDTAGNIGRMNDLWVFDTMTVKQWRNDTGDFVFNNITGTPGNYINQGAFSATAYPGGRHDMSTWTTANGRYLWTFGGYGYASEARTLGELNDLWIYDTQTQQWKWQSGSKTVNPLSIMGSKGTPGAATVPGGRDSAACWVAPDSSVHIFGGFGSDSRLPYNRLNDLWKFDTAATQQWAWINGPDRQNFGGYYGQYSTISGGYPGGRYFGSSWRAADGSLWMYGGLGYDATGMTGALGDLWWLDPDTKEWAWIGGSDMVNPAYNAARPSGRYGAFTWTGTDGKLWMYGGTEYYVGAAAPGFASDLWSINAQTAQWTLEKGTRVLNSPAVYPNKGTESESATPGARMRGQTWVTADGRMWLFGGQVNINATKQEMTNDLWVLNPANKRWMWVAGTNHVNSYGVYGTQGEAAAANTPGARVDACSWTDNLGRLWLFGGYGFDSTPSSSGNLGVMLNDLWMFDPATGQWTWVNGSKIGNASTVPGTPGVYSSTGMPGARTGSSFWQTPDGTMWLACGYGIGTDGLSGWRSDLWCYDLHKNQWAWVTQKSPAANPTVSPLSGRSYSIAWTASDGKFFLFGGDGLDRNAEHGVLNDFLTADFLPFDIAMLGGDFTAGVSQPLVPGSVLDFSWNARANIPFSNPVWCEIFASKTGGFDQVRFGGTVTDSYVLNGLSTTDPTPIAPGNQSLRTLPDGVYTLIPSINRQTISGSVYEADYLNNWLPVSGKRLRIRNTQAAACNLTFEGDVQWITKPDISTYAEVHGTVTNAGPSTNSICWLEVFYGNLNEEGILDPQGTASPGVLINSLPAGGKQEFVIYGYVPDGVSSTALAALIDSTDLVPESVETDNSRLFYNPEILPPGRHSGVDLKVLSVTPDPAKLAPYQVAPGETLNWTVTVENRGTADCGNTWLELFASQDGGVSFARGATLTTSNYVKGPDAGQTQTYNLSSTVNPIGDGIYTAVGVANRNAVPSNPGDENPLDNQLAFSAGRISISTPAVAGSDVNITWTEPPVLTRTDHGTVVITGTLRNNGTTSSGAFWTEAWTGTFENGTGFFTRKKTVAGGVLCTDLAPGAIFHVEIEGFADLGDSLGICADITDLVAETDETDNYYYDRAP